MNQVTDKDLQKKCYEFGKNYLGPFLLGFIQWLEKECELKNINKIFFFSRDGFMMKKAYEVKNYKRAIEYVYFSRKSIRQALLYKCSSYEESIKYMTEERYVSIGKILDYYGLDDFVKTKIYKEYKTDAEILLEFDQLKNNSLIKEIYVKYKNLIGGNSKEQAELLKKYIYQINMIGKCGIVDIGWHGSMQFYLEKFFFNEDIDAELYGYYVGINPSYKLMGQCKGYLFEPNNLQLYKSVMCFHGGYEKLFQSIEGSTAGYKITDNIIYPEKKQYEYSEDLISRINSWQAGAMEYVASNELDADAYIDAARKLINFGKNPPLWGIDIFQGFFLDDGQFQWFVSDKLIFKFKITELKHSLGGSVWKTGFLKSIFRLPGPYFFIYEVMKN